MRTRRKETKQLYEIPVEYSCRALRKYDATMKGKITVKALPSRIEKIWDEITENFFNEIDSELFMFGHYKELKADTAGKETTK